MEELDHEGDDEEVDYEEEGSETNRKFEDDSINLMLEDEDKMLEDEINCMNGSTNGVRTWIYI